MSERLEGNPEAIENSESLELKIQLAKICRGVLSEEDARDLDDLEDNEIRLGYVYGRILEEGEYDPDEIFKEYGVTEGDSDE